MTERVVVLLDMDCFYVQVEERHYPHIRGLPAAVVQYNSWKGGGIIAVNYEARAFGVKRGMRGDEARSKCPDIQLVTVPVNRGKADLTRYRDAGKEVINVLCDYSECVERASIDEAYIDFTSTVEDRMQKNIGRITPDRLKSTWVVGYDAMGEEISSEEKEELRKCGIQEWLSLLYGDEEEESLPVNSSHPHWDNIRLAHTAILCEEMRAAVLERTGFKCSAGIAHNKMLGKLSCGLHKPNQQTVLPQCNVPQLWETLPIGKVRNLGGKLGDSLTDDFGCKTMGELSMLSLHDLTARYDNKTAQWLYNLGKGIDLEGVTSRQLPKSIGCGKNFQGKEILNTREKVQKWMLSLVEELAERLDIDQNTNKRRAKTLTVSVRLDGDARFTSLSRSGPLPSYCAERISKVALSLIQHTNQAPAKSSSWTPSIKNISLSAGKFEDWTSAGSGDIQAMFKKAMKKSPQKSSSENVQNCNDDGKVMPASDCETAELTSSVKGRTSPARNAVINSKCVSKDRVSPKKNLFKPDTSASKSFFKNFLLRRENLETEPEKCSTNSSEATVNEIVADDARFEERVKDGEEGRHVHSLSDSDNEEEEDNNDLDLLVSFLSDDEETLHGKDVSSNEPHVLCDDSDDESVYSAATDVDSQSPCRLPESQDLFAEYDVVGEDCINKQDKVDVAEVTVCNEENAETEDNNYECANNLSTNNRLEGTDCSSPIAGDDVSVEELFPDLDNVDESLLAILPEKMKLEVEKAVRDHKAKFQQKKTGLWKYVTKNPSPQKNTSINVHDPGSIAGTSGRIIVPMKNGKLNESKQMGDDHFHSDDGKYLSKSEALIEHANLDTGDMMECEECGLNISAFEMPEHADYHVALSLQTDMRKEANQVNRRSIEVSDQKRGKNDRGRKRGKSSHSVQGHKVQKLDSFFKLKN